MEWLNRQVRYTSRQFRRIWSPSKLMFGVFWDAFLASTAFLIALKIARYNGEAMSYFWYAMWFFFVLALGTAIRIQMEPKKSKEIDKLITTLQTVADNLGKLVERIDNHYHKEK